MAAVNSGAMGALQLEDNGRHAEALSRAKTLANKHKTSAKAHNLLGYLHRQAAARADGDLASRHYEEACKAYSKAASLVPKCVVTSITRAEALVDYKQYVEAMSELTRVKQITKPVDPAPHYVGAERNKFGYHEGNTKEDRLQNCVDMRLLMVAKLQDFIEIQIVPREADELLRLSSDEAVIALERTKHLAKEWPSSGRVQLLVAHLQRHHDLTINPGTDNAAILRSTLSTVKELMDKFPRTLRIALYQAHLLDELDEPTSIDKCRQALSMEGLDDPMLHDLTLGYFEGRDKDERVATARSKLQALHDQIIADAKLVRCSFERKDVVTDVRVDALAEHFATHDQQFSKTVHDACSFFKEHHQWDFYLGTLCNTCIDISSLQQDWSNRMGFEMFDEILGDNVYISEANDSRLYEISYVPDSLQNDIFHLPNVDYVFDLILSQSDAPLISEFQLQAKKVEKELKIFAQVQKELRSLPGKMGSPQYEESCNKIRNLWINVLESMHFDYREIVVPLAHKFQWIKLKECIADAKNRPGACVLQTLGPGAYSQ